MGILDDTFAAFSNISFILSLTVCLWVVIASICFKTTIHFQSPIPHLKILCKQMAHAQLGCVLR